MYSRKNLVYIFTILECIEKIFIYSNDCNDEVEFFEKNNQMNFNACYGLLLVVGEESKKIEPDLKARYTEIDWKNIVDFRNVLAHDYTGVESKIIFSAIKTHLPNLKECAVDMITKIGMEQSEIKEMVETDWYKHLTYLLK